MTLPTGAVKTKTVAGFVVHYIHDHELTVITKDIFHAEEYRFDSHRRSPRILDCGAHIGLSVLYFKRRYPNARITAFEPSPDTFELLTRNVRGNGFSDVELVNSAVSDQPGTLDFYVPRSPLAVHWADAAVKNDWYSEEVWQTIQVSAVPLANYLTETVDFLKMDIEGLESRVLTGSARELRTVRRMTVEFHSSNPDNQLAIVRQLLDRAGLTTVLRQHHWLTREADLKGTEPYLIHAFRSRIGLAWFLRRDVIDRLRVRCGLIPAGT